MQPFLPCLFLGLWIVGALSLPSPERLPTEQEVRPLFSSTEYLSSLPPSTLNLNTSCMLELQNAMRHKTTEGTASTACSQGRGTARRASGTSTIVRNQNPHGDHSGLQQRCVFFSRTSLQHDDLPNLPCWTASHVPFIPFLPAWRATCFLHWNRMLQYSHLPMAQARRSHHIRASSPHFTTAAVAAW